MGHAFLKELDFPPATPEMSDLFLSDSLIIVDARHVFNEKRAFNCYQILIPLTDFPYTEVDNKNAKILPHHIYPLNPEQTIYAFPRIQNHSYVAMFLKKEIFQEIILTTGERPEKAFFENRSYILPPNLWATINLFKQELLNKQIGYELILSNLSTQIAIQLLRTFHKRPFDFTESRLSCKRTTDLIIEYFMEHYHHHFSLEEVAKMANYSPYHLIRIFKAETGKTPFEYLLEIKIQKAKEILEDKNKTVTQTCHECGFNNLSHFTRTFKKMVGVSPTKYRDLMS